MKKNIKKMMKRNGNSVFSDHSSSPTPLWIAEEKTTERTIEESNYTTCCRKL